jgi:hypothetical protein
VASARPPVRAATGSDSSARVRSELCRQGCPRSVDRQEVVPVRIAVAGATGNIGSLTAAALERDGHDVVRISRSLGVDLVTGEGLDDALVGRGGRGRRDQLGGGRRRRDGRALRRRHAHPAGRGGAGGGPPPRAGLDRRAAPHRGQRALRGEAGAGAPGGRGAGAVDDRAGHPVPRLRRDGDELDRAGRRRHDRAAARPADRPRGRRRRPRRDRGGPRRRGTTGTSPGRRRRTWWTWRGAPWPPGGAP